MRSYVLPLCGLVALSLFGSANGFAAPSLPAAPATPPSSQAPDPVIHIAPHRAIYKMSLAQVKNGSNVTEATGRMLFEWRDVCDGWAIQQHMQLHFAYTDGEDQDIVSTELTWESKDGKQFNYNIHRATNGKETENYRGKASLNEDGSGTASYTTPADKTEKLPIGTIFPSAHTVLILQKAMQGEKMFSRHVFDGSDETGSNDISAFVLPQQPLAQDASIDTKLKSKPLLAESAWPVHMAFFSPGSETGEPDYEMDLNLLPNGVARHMKIDYSDFSVAGNLEEIEALPPQKCP